ncbi:MAG: aminoacyl-tRNA hydrolase [Clostridiaceae bacterium]|nr:aminoacyl-tRNA hydrolase [Clostridiaceae bacterium]
MEDLYIVVGLGNPGQKYECTRHNVGFDTIELLGRKHGITVNKLKHKALSGEGSIGGRRVMLVKPQTFMNLSGESVRDIVDWYKVSVENILVIYDDIDLPLGKLKIRPKGSSGTHNGMRSVIYQLQSDEFPRIRIGIDKPPEGWELSNFVLSRFSGDDRKKIEEIIGKAADAVEEILRSGIDQAMNRYNR